MKLTKKYYQITKLVINHKYIQKNFFFFEKKIRYFFDSYVKFDRS